jgi:hypothetical protein
MANLKISELPLGSLPIGNDDLFAIVQGSTTNKIPFSGLTYSSVLNSAQTEDWGSGTPLQTISASTIVASRTIDVSGNAPCLVIMSVTYKCVSGTVADTIIELQRDAGPQGINTFANIGTTDYYTTSLNFRDGGTVGSPATVSYDLFFNIGTAAEFEIHGYSISVVEL